MRDVLIRGASQLGLGLSRKQIRLFESYYEELVAARRFFCPDQGRVSLDCLVALSPVPVIKELFAGDHIKVIDVGTGFGFPGIPLSIVLPSVEFVLMDGVGTNTTFISQVADKLRLENVRALNGEAEDLAHEPEYRESFDLAVCRAVGTVMGLPFVRLGGFETALMGGDNSTEVRRQSRMAIQAMGGRLKEVREIMKGLYEHRLVVVEKAYNTPSEYPHRPGRPAQRTLPGQ